MGVDSERPQIPAVERREDGHGKDQGRGEPGGRRRLIGRLPGRFEHGRAAAGMNVDEAGC